MRDEPPETTSKATKSLFPFSGSTAIDKLDPSRSAPKAVLLNRNVTFPAALIPLAPSALKFPTPASSRTIMTLPVKSEFANPPAGLVNAVQRKNDSFRPMEPLLQTWRAGARFAEITHVIVLAKVELARRGIT